jgi:phosphoglucosamine mutase
MTTPAFGTDGVRGVANDELTVEHAVGLGRAVARVLEGDHVVVGRDTRRSGPMLEAALAAGFAAEGWSVARVGVVPTPAVAWLAARDGCAGAMISASHNPFADNGIKVFAPGGRKLRDEVEARIAAELTAALAAGPHAGPTGAAVGNVTDAAVDGYLEHLLAAVGPGAAAGLRVVLDCAHGAASAWAPELFRRAGADVVVVHAEPDGVNINAESGATHLDGLQRAVVATGADLGLAFDGDADRCLAVDHVGGAVDGDHVIALCALDRRRRGALAGDAVVVTVMTNLGFRHAMARHGIGVVETPVGDRHVLAALEERALVLGGEQSGHVVFRDVATTGDGLLTGLVVADIVRRARRPLAELAAEAMTRLPQVLRNVRVAGSARAVVAGLEAEIGAAATALGERGRVLVRASGTEPLVRVMVEAPTLDEAEATAAALVGAVEAAIG